MAVRRSIITDQLSMNFEKALLMAKKDFDLVEIHSLWDKTVEQIDDEEARLAESLLKKHSLGVSCLSTTLYLMCPLYTKVQHLDEFSDKFLVFAGDRGAHLEMLRRCIELADRLGTSVLRIFPFRLEKGVQKDFPQLIEDMHSALEDAVVLAEKNGKCLAVENCPYTYLPRGNMTFQLASAFHSPSLRLLYDIGNSYRSAFLPFPEHFKAESLGKEYERIKDMVAHFHFKDYRKRDNGFAHAALGEGDIGYKELMRSIRRDMGEVCVSLEPEVDEASVLRSVRNFIAM
jgi:L-ribulose-5-phosphate 3-epimerase